MAKEDGYVRTWSRLRVKDHIPSRDEAAVLMDPGIELPLTPLLSSAKSESYEGESARIKSQRICGVCEPAQKEDVNLGKKEVYRRCSLLIQRAPTPTTTPLCSRNSYC